MEVSSQIHTPAVLSPGKMVPVPIREEAGWAPEPVWTRKREKFFAPARNRIPIVQSVVSHKMTELPRLQGVFCNRLYITQTVNYYLVAKL
jgi:hypothetical protein